MIPSIKIRPQPSFHSELQSPHMPTIGAVQLCPLIHTHHSQVINCTPCKPSLSTQVAAMVNSVARPPESTQPHIMSNTHIKNNSSATNAVCIHYAAFPFLPQLSSLRPINNTGKYWVFSRVSNNLNHTTSHSVWFKANYKPISFRVMHLWKHTRYWHVRCTTYALMIIYDDDHDDDDCNGTNGHPHLLKETSTCSQMERRLTIHGNC